MQDKFELAGGSIIGREHLRLSKNNQDAYYWVNFESATIAVVCDGCGSGTHSEVGAKIGARLVVEAILRNLSQDRLSTEFWQGVHQDLLHSLGMIAVSLGRELVQVVKEYLLFTIIGAVIFPQETALFAIGDGVFALNGEVIPIPHFPDNAPPYLGYGLISDILSHMKLVDCQFCVHRQLPTPEVQSILIGTDGVEDLIAVADRFLPGKSDRVGEIAQYWEDDNYFDNPYFLTRRLALINHTSIKPDWETRYLKKQNGLLPDDTTLVVIRNREEEGVMEGRREGGK
ncbi:protein phosphatase 2C domain-containing protein [Calothrix rhizosoleniae]|uniref:protein phosphatase 2C domain-containing protein n=1 Tax=Calothrix rhizosoleniae TaxID=888997 RepID=UPI000B4A0F53|nr:protein phosphatase 2C domain-containing protein [Calothrix rhizosoleniae]